MLSTENWGASPHYISSSFFEGITLGRVVLPCANEKVEEYLIIRVVTSFSLGLAAFHSLYSWECMTKVYIFEISMKTPTAIGGAVAVSFVAPFSEPVHSILMIESRKLILLYLLTRSIKWT